MAAEQPDRGTEWHPRGITGDLPDLNEEQMATHLAKPECADEREAGPFAAEDSTVTPEDVV